MTEETLKKGNEITKEIEKCNLCLSGIVCGLENKKRKDKEAKKRGFYLDKWTFSKFFSLLTYANNKARLVPHYEFAQGIEFDVDEDFVLMVKDYFEKKKAKLENELAELK